jgi:hypothetical protein
MVSERGDLSTIARYRVGMRMCAVALALMDLLTSAAAQPAPVAVTQWQPVGDSVATVNTHVVGDIETLPDDGGLRVRGWIVDAFSAARPDQITLGDLAGRQVGQVRSGGFMRRADVAERFGSSAYALSGFEVLVSDPPTTVLVNAHLGQLGWWQATVVTGVPRTAHVMRLACTSDDTAEVEVTSAEPFPVRNALAELHVGVVSSSLSRYPDGGDTHTLIFLLTREQFLAISPDDSGFVGYNPGNEPDRWLMGPIDPASAADCGANRIEQQ